MRSSELTPYRAPPTHDRAPPTHEVIRLITDLQERFVARMPQADSTTGLPCCLRSFPALGDQRAEILAVRRLPTLAVGARCMMRLVRILMFPFFLSASWISCLKIEVPSKMSRRQQSLSFERRTFLCPKCRNRSPGWHRICRIIRSRRSSAAIA
jgi:hypothetical protein